MSGFSTDQVFKSREELMEWVRNTGRSLGYAIVTKRSKAKNGYVSKVVLMCDRGGVYKSDKDSSRETGTRKINCPFEMVAKFSKKNGSWTLKVKPGEHNHPPGEYMEGHPILKRLTPNEHQLVAELTGKGVFPKDILGVIKERDENNVSTIKNIYNARDKIRATDHKGKSLMEVLMSHLNDKGYTFEISTNRVSNMLEDLFFVPKISYKYFLDFPHVLLMDVTYNTNKYKLPFLEIVGVTSTNKTISIAFAVMRKETEEKYLWALNCLKSTLDERSMQQPRVIVTDRELALMNACEKVFPNATRLLCRCHVSQSIFRNCKSFFATDHDWKIFNTMWNALVESQTWTSFLQNYKQLQSMLIHHQGMYYYYNSVSIIVTIVIIIIIFADVLDYLNSTWLNKYKEMFVSVWTNECLHFGNQTTNRAESQHAKLKKFLNSANCTLDKIVRHIEDCANLRFNYLFILNPLY
ncbi:putative transcription factor FAR family [Helianthus annuus]|nr:putative transcription factor FAR family [Helianthus annuus]